MEMTQIEDRIVTAQILSKQIDSLLKTANNLLILAGRLKSLDLNKQADLLQSVTCDLLTSVSCQETNIRSLTDVQSMLIGELE